MKFCGIDFGTTNTAMVYFDDKYGKKQLGDSISGDIMPLPSIVAIHKKTGSIFVGADVKRNIKGLEKDFFIVMSIKTILDDTSKVWYINNKKLNTIDIAAEIFKKLKLNASYEGIEVKDIVLSVPINFSASKKQCLKEATERAELHITEFISEPTAAFLAHYEELKCFKNVVIFDWGGGTLDISALEVKNDTIREIYTDNMYKAGDNIDRDFARKTYERLIREKNLQPIPFDKLNANIYDLFITTAEKNKISFSRQRDLPIKCPHTINGKSVSITFYYEDLVNVSKPYIKEAIEKLNNVITNAFSDTVSCILCVGGSSNLRTLREELYKIYGNKLYFPDTPEWDIADGACTIAASNKANIYKLADNISLKLSDGNYLPLLEQGQPIPCKPASFNLAVTDSTNQANFVFKIGNKDEHSVVVPFLGGVDEFLTLYTYVDEYNVLRIDVKNSKTQEVYNIFNYEKIDLCYNV